jgi:hypothetical protein
MDFGQAQENPFHHLSKPINLKETHDGQDGREH